MGITIAFESMCAFLIGTVIGWSASLLLPYFLGEYGKNDDFSGKLSNEKILAPVYTGLGFMITIGMFGPSTKGLLTCALIAILVLMAFVDVKTFEIPMKINILIFILAMANLLADREHLVAYIFGFWIISFPLFLIFLASDGKAIGGGDIKLMAALGLFMGAKLVPVAFFLACLIAVPTHLIKMKFKGVGHVLAMGPYLALGAVLSIWFGETIISWYIGAINSGL